MAVYVYGIGLLLFCALVQSLRVPQHATVVRRVDIANETYDFVIAGGGISGLTVADRLTEDPNVHVLVLEAGPFDEGEDSVLVPGAYNPIPYVWPGLLSTPQAALNNSVYFAITGRVVGGGSAVNAMIFLRGDKVDYGGWAELGNEGWEWDDLLPYFVKSENFTFPDADFATAANISWIQDVHGREGPVQATYPNYFFSASGNWHSAVLETGLAVDEDPNDGSLHGLFWLPIVEDARTRTRNYARINHYDRVQSQRPNYHVLADTTVSRVLFSGKTATGVEYLPTAGGNKSVVMASKEVLVAAGGLHTPQILQRSGVGSSTLLAPLGITVVEDLPGVGQNFQDQPTIPMTYNFSSNVEPNWGTLLNNATYDAEQRALYDANQTGPYTLVRTLATNFAVLSLADATSDVCAIAAAASDRNASSFLPPGTDATVLAGYEAQRLLLLQQLQNPDVAVGGLHWNTDTTYTLYTFKPFSRGTITIDNAEDALAAPLIDYRTVTDPTDIEVYTALVRKAREIMAAPSMSVLGPVEEAPFGSNVQTDDDIQAAVRSAISPTNGHPCCTAAMMPRELGGVVDAQLRVHGLEHLRVIDSSYFPLAIGGAPSATLYATGEKIANIIQQTYGYGLGE